MVTDTRDLNSIQPLIWPEFGVCTELDLYARLDGAAGYSSQTGSLEFESGGTARFDTYFNLFNVGKWVRYCDLADIRLSLCGEGTFELVIFQTVPDRSWERLYSEIVTLRPGHSHVADASNFREIDAAGILHFRMKALGKGRLDSAEWQTAQAPLRRPDLALSITTFRREEAVRASVRRFEAFMDRSPIAAHLHLIVVDNGQSAGLTASPHVTPVLSENLGGSGGFARGLIEAERRGASHCLFMDDDASIHMASLERTWWFLAYATDPATAVAGAMTIAAHKWALWENGATFDSACRPRFLGTDLRDFAEVLQMEVASTEPAPYNLYGGWWYFAFPIAQATYRPFPFFVRGDDVSFGLANPFRIVTLPGVVSFQDADFSQKETLQTLYLDLRSHLAHHLALPKMDIGRLRTLRIAAWFFGRSLVQMHYETLASLNLALADVIEGPSFFAANADMADRRATIAKLRKAEAWTPCETAPPPGRRRINPDFWGVAQLMNLTLNGHLLPFFRLWGDRITIAPGDRGNLHAIWGAAQVTCYDAKAGQAFTVRHSKREALRQVWQLFRNGRRFWKDYDRIKANWREGYRQLTTDDFWIRRMNLAPLDEPAAPPRPE